MKKPFIVRALPGCQGGVICWTAVLTLRQLVDLLPLPDASLQPERRAQRSLQEARAHGIADYIGQNTGYAIPPITLSASKVIKLADERVQIPSDAKIFCNDGQHRRRAIEIAIEEHPALADDTVTAVIYEDSNLASMQQRFADLNSGQPAARSVRLLYDLRRAGKGRAASLIEPFAGLVEMQAANASPTSGKLWTLSGLDITPAIDQTAFWTALLGAWPEVAALRAGQVMAQEVRKRWVWAHNVGLQGIGFLVGKADPVRLAREINWSRENPEWTGRAQRGTKMLAPRRNAVLIANLLLQKTGLALPPQHAKVEAAYLAEASTVKLVAVEPPLAEAKKQGDVPRADGGSGERESRLPPIGTILIKTDRHGTERVRCKIVPGGIEYAGVIYKSLSGAGLKAMADLGLKATTCDGLAFWGLKKGESARVEQPVSAPSASTAAPASSTAPAVIAPPMKIDLGKWAGLLAAGPFAYGDVPSFAGTSGGRTSAVQAALLDPRVRLCFENTGKEDERTLVFLERLADALQREIVWLEWRPPKRVGAPPREFGFEIVNYKTAHRGMEVMRGMLRALASFRATKGLPPITPYSGQRICTGYLKHKVQEHYIESLGIDWRKTDTIQYVGLRSDEPSRLRDLASAETQTRTFLTPLADAGITKADVMTFWRAQSFDLELPNEWDGNCNKCFLKDNAHLSRKMGEDEADAAEWIALQQEFPGFGGKQRMSYEALLNELPTRRAVEAALRAGAEPVDDGRLGARRFKLVVVDERKFLKGEASLFSCACEATLVQSEGLDDAVSAS